MAETPNQPSSCYIRNSTDSFSNAVKSYNLRGSVSNGRFQTPIRLRHLEQRYEGLTETSHFTPISNIHSTLESRSASISNFDNKRSLFRSLLPPVDMIKEGPQEFLTLKHTRSITISQTNNIMGIPVRRPSRVSLKPIEQRKRESMSPAQLDKSDSQMTPRTLEKISLDMKRASSVVRDISRVVEPIAKHGSRKIRAINDICSRKNGKSLMEPPKSEFEAEIMEAVRKKFIRQKLENEQRTIKPVRSEKFTVKANQEVYFKLFAKDLRFPLTGNIVSSVLDNQYTMFISLKEAKPYLDKCDYYIVNKEFFVESQENVDWVYFTLTSSLDMNLTLWIFPAPPYQKSEEKVSYRLTPTIPQGHGSPTDENSKGKNERLYPFMNYTPDQMAEFMEEISMNERRIKTEKQEKKKKLAKDGRNIVSTNACEIFKYNKESYKEKIQNFKKIRKEAHGKIARRREKTEYLETIKKLISSYKEEIKQEARKNFEEEVKNNELRKERSDKWVDSVGKCLVIYGIAKKLWDMKAYKLIMRIKNRKASLLQRVYRKFIEKKERSNFLRTIVDIREALCCVSCIGRSIAIKKGGRLIMNFLREYPAMENVLQRTVLVCGAIRKIQRMARQFNFRKHFQRVCLFLMIEDIVAKINEEKKKKKDKKKLKGTKKKDKEREKDKDNEKERAREKSKEKKAQKEKEEPVQDKARTMFDTALQVSKDFRVFLTRLYYQEILKNYKIYIKNNQGKAEEEKTEGDYSDSSFGGETDRKGPKNRMMIEMGNLSPREQGRRALQSVYEDLRVINRKAFFYFVEENYERIVEKAMGHGKLSWLFQ